MVKKNEFGKLRKATAISFNKNCTELPSKLFQDTYYEQILSPVFKEKYGINYSVGLIFYDNCKVGYFAEVNLSDRNHFNPQRSRMGFYDTDTQFYLQTYVSVPSLFDRTLKKVRYNFADKLSTKDTLVFTVVKSSIAYTDTLRYRARKLSFDINGLKPDW